MQEIESHWLLQTTEPERSGCTVGQLDISNADTTPVNEGENSCH